MKAKELFTDESGKLMMLLMPEAERPILYGYGSDKYLNISFETPITRQELLHTIVTFFKRSEWGKFDGRIFVPRLTFHD